MEILDQEGQGKEASIEDIRRVLGTYSSMTEEEINHYLELNCQMEEQQAKKKVRRTTILPSGVVEEISKDKVDLKSQMDSMFKKPKVDKEKLTVNIDSSVNFMFNDLKI